MTVKNTLFDPQDTKTQALLLAKHLPMGKLWQAAFDGNRVMGKLIQGLAIEFFRLEVIYQTLYREMDINQTTELIAEWEESVGIPDECFGIDVTIEERRIQVREKFSNFGGVQLAEDFVRVGAVFGFELTVTSGKAGSPTPIEFPITFPLGFSVSSKEAKHTMYVNINNDLSGSDVFPLTFPIPFASGAQTFLQCIFDFLAAANVKVIITTEGS
jgi:uncharacterized protein YmfQ (DUF2313 family)